jgi:hypothetical protein
MTPRHTDAPLLDAADSEASAMWTGDHPGDCGRNHAAPYFRSASEIHARELGGGLHGRLTGFVDGRRSGSVRVTAGPARESVRVAADIALDDQRSGWNVRHLEATVRASWLRRVLEEPTGPTDAAARIVRALEQIAALPGQTTVLMREGGVGAK